MGAMRTKRGMGAVHDGPRARRTGRLSPYRKVDLTPLSKLDGVAKQIHQHLTKPQGITHHHLRQHRIEVADQLEIFFRAALETTSNVSSTH